MKDALVAERAATTEDETWAALGRYEAACRGGQAAACWLYERRQRTPVEKWEPRRKRAEVLDPKCKAGDPVACHRIGLLLDDDLGVSPDGKGALLRFEQACAGGYAYACVRAATFYESSEQPNAKQKAEAHHRKACDAGFAKGCAELARLMELRPQPAPASEVAIVDERACARGAVKWCVFQVERLIPWTEFACDQCRSEEDSIQCMQCAAAECRRKKCCPTCPERMTSGCCEEGEIPQHPLTTTPVDPGELARARGVASQRLSLAARVLAAVCDAADEEACAELAKLVDKSRTLELKLEREPELWSKACRGSKAKICLSAKRPPSP